LRPDDVAYLIELGAGYFAEIACFTNGTFLTRDLAQRLKDAGLSYLCYSRHHYDDKKNRALMGEAAPRLSDFVESARSLKIRATCVMSRDWISNVAAVSQYIDALKPFGVREFTFKHTYVAYEHSVFQGSPENDWAGEHRIEFDPFEGQGEIVAGLPWGPVIRRLEGVQVCYYREPTPSWELENRLCRSSNLLSDGSVYASLEDQRSLLYRLTSS
jgi:cyclic pyranopterin phosphate synthase